ncbi:MAG: hypothetical protein A3A86_07020 [Elusimicrobia bacterium RIFCSPLOWO2_01_FULL_60_11]|nr:MAG: hypothetical protein A3A86_07020 [Elusimicrobia bacterium RIFCSPLOWO2_01_FULL_60_11]
MRWASASSDNPVFETAVEECCRHISKELGGEPDLAVVFVSMQHLGSYADVPARIYKRMRPARLIGCSAGGVIGGGREIEQKTGVSITAALLPGVEIATFHIGNDGLPGPDARPKAWHELTGVTPERSPSFILLADPFSFDAENFLKGMDYAFSKSTKVGGLASGARKPGENALFIGHEVYREGLIGAALTGDIRVDAVVAQGCRPIGEPLLITACDGNVLLELNDEPPLKVLEDVYGTLTPRDQELVKSSLFLGVVMDATMSDYARGDFLIRNIVGADAEKGILAVGTDLREGQTVQFHLRDAQTSAEDLDLMLANYASERTNGAAGSLLFSCLGRGVYLYGTPDHDTKAFQKSVGNIPVGGFFCNGEMGPVKNTTYLHGYTSCFGIFRPAGGS